jgi:hypothetical protein
MGSELSFLALLAAVEAEKARGCRVVVEVRSWHEAGIRRSRRASRVTTCPSRCSTRCSALM